MNATAVKSVDFTMSITSFSRENTLQDTTADAVAPPSTMEVTKIRTARSSASEREAGRSLANEQKRA